MAQFLSHLFALLSSMSSSLQALRLVDGSVQDPDRRFDDGWETDFPRLPLESSINMSIPDGMDQMPPGPELGAILASVDVHGLSGYDRVVVLRAHQRMVAHHQAQLYDAMVSIRDQFIRDGWDSVDAGACGAAEIRTALHLTRRTADVDLSFALDLARRLPRVLQMLGDGRLDYRRAKTIERSTCHLSDAVADGVVERIVETAPLMTTGQLQARIRELAIEADPEDAKNRHDHAVVDRKLVTEPTLDGTANLTGLNLPPDRVAVVSRRINTIAKSLRGPGESRTMDQLRADIYLDLLQGKQHKTTGNSVIQMTVDLDTLAALTEHPGDLAGFGPVISDIARQVVEEHPDAQWRWLITDTETGQHLCDGITRRRPSASQKRTIQARDRTCSFPGCRMPGIDCDIDHIKEFADGGPTCPCNNALDCRHDHQLKDYGWTYQRLPKGRYQWTSPFGHTYTTWKPPP